MSDIRPKLYEHARTKRQCIAREKWDAAQVLGISHSRMSSDLNIVRVEYPDYWKYNTKRKTEDC